MENYDIEIPSCEADITPEWVAKITGHSVLSESVKIEGDVQKGDGYLSSIFRVAYKTVEGEDHQIILKLLPTNPEFLDLMLADESDVREMKMYSVCLPDFLKIVPELKENVCNFYHGSVKQADPSKGRDVRSSLIVMEDLKPLGYKMMDFSGESSDERLNSIMKFFARLHFCSLAVEADKRVPLSSVYPFMQGITTNVEYDQQLGNMAYTGFNLLDKLLADHNVSYQTREKYRRLQPHFKAVIPMIKDAGRKFPCLIHGDGWPPNFQVHDSLPIKVIDWQLIGYRDPTYDLSFVLHMVLPREKLTMENITRLLKLYYDEFETLCILKGYQDKIKRRDWEEFKEFFFTWGVSFLFWLTVPYIDAFDKDQPKYSNMFRFMCEESDFTEYLLKQCLI